MSETFRIYQVPEEAPELNEVVGSKGGFWFREAELGTCLFKPVRKTGEYWTGEDWSEKIASELAEALEIPHARVELAEWRGIRGIVTPTLVPRAGALIHGNEVLVERVPDYPAEQPAFRRFWLVRPHTLDVVLEANQSNELTIPPGWVLPPGIERSIEVFVGYLLLDAWIGNTDRHHQNWAWIQLVGGRRHLCPSYDHASSLGRELRDAEREARLHTRDREYSVEAYAEKARSAFFRHREDKRPMKTLEVFFAAAERFPQAAEIWGNRLEMVTESSVAETVERVPMHLMSMAARAFVSRLLAANRRRLLAGIGEE